MKIKMSEQYATCVFGIFVTRNVRETGHKYIWGSKTLNQAGKYSQQQSSRPGSTFETCWMWLTTTAPAISRPFVSPYRQMPEAKTTSLSFTK